MLLWLTQYLSEYVSGFGVFQYLTLRTMVSVVTALAVSLLIGPRMISWLTQSQIGQQVAFAIRNLLIKKLGAVSKIS